METKIFRNGLMALAVMGTMLLSACPPPVSTSTSTPTTVADYNVTLPQAVYDDLTNQLANPSQVKIQESDLDWGLVVGTLVQGVAMSADASSLYVAVVPDMVTNNNPNMLTNITQPDATVGYPFQAINGASINLSGSLANDYFGFTIGEIGVTNNSHEFGTFYGQKAIRMGVADKTVDGKKILVVVLDKAAVQGNAGAWGDTSSLNYKFGFVKKTVVTSSSYQVANTVTPSYVFIPSKNMVTATASILNWDKTTSFTLISTDPTDGGSNFVSTHPVTISIFGGPLASLTNSGNLSAGVTAILSGATNFTNDGSNIPASISGYDLQLTLPLKTKTNYTLTLNNLVDASTNTNTTPIVISFSTADLVDVTFWYTNISTNSVPYNGDVAFPCDFNGWDNGGWAVTVANGVFSNTLSIPTSQVPNAAGAGGKIVESGTWNIVEGGDDGSGGNISLPDFSSFDPATQGIKIEYTNAAPMAITIYTK